MYVICPAERGCVTRRIPAAGSSWRLRRVPGRWRTTGYWVSCGSVGTRLLYCRTRSEASQHPERSCSERNRHSRWVSVQISASGDDFSVSDLIQKSLKSRRVHATLSITLSTMTFLSVLRKRNYEIK